MVRLGGGQHASRVRRMRRMQRVSRPHVACVPVRVRLDDVEREDRVIGRGARRRGRRARRGRRVRAGRRRGDRRRRRGGSRRRRPAGRRFGSGRLDGRDRGRGPLYDPNRRRVCRHRRRSVRKRRPTRSLGGCGRVHDAPDRRGRHRDTERSRRLGEEARDQGAAGHGDCQKHRRNPAFGPTHATALSGRQHSPEVYRQQGGFA